MGIWEGSLGCEFLLGWMCAEGMGCGRRWCVLIVVLISMPKCVHTLSSASYSNTSFCHIVAAHMLVARTPKITIDDTLTAV